MNKLPAIIGTLALAILTTMAGLVFHTLPADATPTATVYTYWGMGSKKNIATFPTVTSLAWEVTCNPDPGNVIYVAVGPTATRVDLRFIPYSVGATYLPRSPGGTLNVYTQPQCYWKVTVKS